VAGEADEESLTEGRKQREQETAAQPAGVLAQKMECVASVAAHGLPARVEYPAGEYGSYERRSQRDFRAIRDSSLIAPSCGLRSSAARRRIAGSQWPRPRPQAPSGRTELRG